MIFYFFLIPKTVYSKIIIIIINYNYSVINMSSRHSIHFGFGLRPVSEVNVRTETVKVKHSYYLVTIQSYRLVRSTSSSSSLVVDIV